MDLILDTPLRDGKLKIKAEELKSSTWQDSNPRPSSFQTGRPELHHTTPAPIFTLFHSAVTVDCKEIMEKS